MSHIHRLLEKNIRQTLNRGKSVLLLGPRQTGKTTLIQQQIHPDISYSFAVVKTRQRYEKNPALLESELIEQISVLHKMPIVFIDEVQKIPQIMDIAQHLIDSKSAQFILTGSSAHKLKTGRHLNLLPGRVVTLTMTPLLYEELPSPKPSLEDILLYGLPPNILLEPDVAMREVDLDSYVTTYLEEEIRAEALVRHVGHFTRFLEIAASESGRHVNFSRLSQDIGISDTTIANYYQILEDCLITKRIEPIINSQTKRRLIKSCKYLFFDLGIRRACANEGVKLSQRMLGDLFEHYVGNALINLSQLSPTRISVKYWRDSAGPEIDYVLDVSHHYIPIEVKWSEHPSISDAKNLRKFMEEYSAKQGYIVSCTPQRYKLTDDIMVLPWQEVGLIWDRLLA